MLAPDQVIPFFTDERCLVRRQALRYFSDGAYPLGSLNADHLWNVIEHFSAHTCDCLRLIGDVPQTENSFQSLMRAMGERPSELVDFHLQRAAGEIAFDLVVAHRDELLHDSRLLPHVRQHHEQRLKLATQPTDVLWNQLMEHGQEVHACHAGEFDWRISGRLIEALVRRADMQLLDRAIGVLRDAAIRDTWNEVFLVMLLGRARCESAIDLLLEKLLVPDADVLNEESFRALGRIGTIEVVEKAAAAYPGAEWSSRLFVREPIHRIKLPRSESALMQLVEIEEDFELNQFLLSNLCDLGSMQGLQRVRDRVASNCNDPETRDLCASMLATAVMNGVELPEAKQWRRIAERDEAQLRKLIWQMNDGFASAMRDNWRRTGCNSDPVAVEDLPDDDSLSERDYDFDFSLDRLGDEAPMVNAETFRRDSPKIGRNDPCPCGSGKKYKKCCGG